MHSTLFYKDEMDNRCARLMPKIQKLTRLRDSLQARGRSKDAAKVQARIVRYTIEMGDRLPQFVDRWSGGSQLISLFGLEWEQITDDLTDHQGRMLPAHTVLLLARLTNREEFFARNVRRVSRWWIVRNPIRERRWHRKYAALKAFLETALQRKEVLGVAA